MYMKIIGIIPARGGSKKIENKNLKKFCGKPLIAWAILSAKKANSLDRVIVTTDSPMIAKIAKKYGAEVPFLRPDYLATATSSIEPVLKHTYQWLIDNEKYQTDAIVFLPSTNPLRMTSHIEEAIKIFKTKRPDSVISVNQTPANHTPYWTLIHNKTGKITLFGGGDIKNILTRRQDFPQLCFARNDIIYVLNPKNLFEKKPNLYGKNVMLYETSTLYETDINTPEEWADAEIKFKRLRKGH